MPDYADLWLQIEAMDEALRQENAELLDLPFDKQWDHRVKRIRPLAKEWVRLMFLLDKVRDKGDR